MPETSELLSSTGGVTFELDRFELIDGAWELHGRWFGIRGRRFMRPALAVVIDGQAGRVLADISGKPWAAEDGEPWTASFPWEREGRELAEAELTVAPDITVALPAGASGPKARKPTAKKPPARRARSSSSDAARGPGVLELKRQLADAHSAQEQLQRQLERLEAEKSEAVERVADALSQLSLLTRERDEALAARDRANAEREAALAEREQAISQRDAEVQERERAVAERDQAMTAREQALSARTRALAERDAALADREQALVAREQAATAGAQAEHDRAELAAANRELRSELADIGAGRGAAMVMRRAVEEPSAYVPPAKTIPRVLAVALLVAVVVVLLIILRVL